MTFVYNDGGRAAAGFRGDTRDCGVRALAIAANMNYRDAYELIGEFCKKERRSKRRKTRSHPRTGVYRATYNRVLEHLGWKWAPAMQIGSGCVMHVHPDELPHGPVILRLSKHFAAAIDGILHDTYDSSRDGTRCVYGYWYRP